MRKFLLSLTLTFSAIVISYAQTPDAIYIGTWDGMNSNYGTHGVGTPITPNTDDPILTYNSATQCYEGYIYDWAIPNGTAAWNAKIPYSFDGSVVTYYSGTTYSNIDFNNNSTATFNFTPTTVPTDLKGYNLATSNKEAVLGAKVSLSLVENTITFTLVENVTAAPELISISPANGEMIIPNEDGDATVTFTFSGPLTAMRILVEGTRNSQIETNTDNSVWTVTVPQEAIEESINENGGYLVVYVDQAYAGDIPIAFNGNLMLRLSYTVKGYTKEAYLQFENVTEDSELAVYKSPNYTVGKELMIIDNELEMDYYGSTTYLFTVAEGYKVEVSSEAPEESWSLGTANSIKIIIDADNEIFEEQPYREGVTLTVNNDANGATFIIKVSEENNDNGEGDGDGIESIIANGGVVKVYSIDGKVVLSKADASVLETLRPGIYVISGKKVMVK